MALVGAVQEWLTVDGSPFDFYSNSKLNLLQLPRHERNRRGVDVSMVLQPGSGFQGALGVAPKIGIPGVTDDGGILWIHGSVVFEARGREPGIDDDDDTWIKHAESVLGWIGDRMATCHNYDSGRNGIFIVRTELATPTYFLETDRLGRVILQQAWEVWYQTRPLVTDTLAVWGGDRIAVWGGDRNALWGIE